MHNYPLLSHLAFWSNVEKVKSEEKKEEEVLETKQHKMYAVLHVHQILLHRHMHVATQLTVVVFLQHELLMFMSWEH